MMINFTDLVNQAFNESSTRVLLFDNENNYIHPAGKKREAFRGEGFVVFNIVLVWDFALSGVNNNGG